ncbi:MAG TPA: cupin domain-containing protein [Anaerolineales bacterium]|nr:cupin domain-containing protein [Anaerolineales bacterium]
MPRQLFTAEDIRRLARERAGPLVLAPDDIVTHEAQDVAFALGLKMIRETESGSSLARSGRIDSGESKSSAIPNLPPLKVVRMANVQVEQFLEGKTTPGTNVWLKDVVLTQDRSPMGAGYMSLDQGEMQWTLSYDEIDIVLEGELVIRRGNEQVRGKTGDVIYIPKGSSITFGTPNWTRFVYVVFPVNWNEK